MNMSRYCKIAAAAFLMALAASGAARAAQCGNSAAGFEGWKQEFAAEARAKGVGASGVAALMGTSYATAIVSGEFPPGSKLRAEELGRRRRLRA